MELEIWSDVACPFCYIGKRNLEAALDSFEQADDVVISWRSFQLAPDMPRELPGSQLEHLARKYGLSIEQARESQRQVIAMAADAGLELDLDRVQLVNTFDAHRVLQHAAIVGLQDAIKERLLRAYFINGENLADHTTLARLATEAGMISAEVEATLASDAYAAAVRADGETARSFGLRGVPAFVLDRRFALTGAQPPELMLQGLQRAWQLRQEA